MSSPAHAIRDAIATELNNPATPWGLAFTAAGAYQTTYEAADLQALQVAVVVPDLEIERQSREKRQVDYTAIIDVQQAVDPTDLPTLDALDDLVDQLEEYYANAGATGGHYVTGDTAWSVLKAKREVVFDLNRLWTERVFEAWIALTVRGYR